MHIASGTGKVYGPHRKKTVLKLKIYGLFGKLYGLFDKVHDLLTQPLRLAKVNGLRNPKFYDAYDHVMTASFKLIL